MTQISILVGKPLSQCYHDHHHLIITIMYLSRWCKQSHLSRYLDPSCSGSFVFLHAPFWTTKHNFTWSNSTSFTANLSSCYNVLQCLSSIIWSQNTLFLIVVYNVLSLIISMQSLFWLSRTLVSETSLISSKFYLICSFTFQ